MLFSIVVAQIDIPFLHTLSSIYCLHFFFFFCFLRPHLQHVEVSRLGVKSELQLPPYTTATAM